MSLDEMARASARRTTQAVAAASDTDRAFRELVTVHRRRVGAKVVGTSALVLAVVLVVVVGTAPSRRQTEPIAPQPTPTKAYLAAPPFCGRQPTFGDEFSQYVDVGHACPTGPGRYLSVLMGIGSDPPFTFTLPPGWTVRGLEGAGGGPIMPALGGLMLKAPSGGRALVVAEYPSERPALSTDTGIVGAPQNIAARLATHQYLTRTTAVRTSLGGREAWRVDLTMPEETNTDGFCVTGDRCAVTFALGGDDFPGRSYLGVVPGTPSRAFVLNGTGGGIPTVVWTYGDPDTDPALASVLAGLDFNPPVVPKG